MVSVKYKHSEDRLLSGKEGVYSGSGWEERDEWKSGNNNALGVMQDLLKHLNNTHSET